MSFHVRGVEVTSVFTPTLNRDIDRVHIIPIGADATYCGVERAESRNFDAGRRVPVTCGVCRDIVNHWSRNGLTITESTNDDTILVSSVTKENK